MKCNKWVIPSAVATQTERALLVGQHEVFCMWTAAAGNAISDEATGSAEVLRCVVPAQTPGETPSGVWVHIAGQELQRIQMDNYHRQERSIVQLHSHPGANVQMSELDREWEVDCLAQLAHSRGDHKLVCREQARLIKFRIGSGQEPASIRGAGRAALVDGT